MPAKIYSPTLPNLQRLAKALHSVLDAPFLKFLRWGDEADRHESFD